MTAPLGLAQKGTSGYVLCVATPEAKRPDWDRLFETAAGQSGYVTTKQAAEAGYSTHLLRKHILAGRVTRPQRGIYRLVHFPVGEHEELVTAWLWSEQAGVVSHQTALSLHGLSDVLPAQVHLTLPEAWRRRRFDASDAARVRNRTRSAGNFARRMPWRVACSPGASRCHDAHPTEP